MERAAAASDPRQALVATLALLSEQLSADAQKRESERARRVAREQAAAKPQLAPLPPVPVQVRRKTIRLRGAYIFSILRIPRISLFRSPLRSCSPLAPNWLGRDRHAALTGAGRLSSAPRRRAHPSTRLATGHRVVDSSSISSSMPAHRPPDELGAKLRPELTGLQTLTTASTIQCHSRRMTQERCTRTGRQPTPSAKSSRATSSSSRRKSARPWTVPHPLPRAGGALKLLSLRRQMKPIAMCCTESLRTSRMSSLLSQLLMRSKLVDAERTGVRLFPSRSKAIRQLALSSDLEG